MEGWVPSRVYHRDRGTDRLFDQFAAHPQGLTAQELAQRTCHAPYVAIWCASAYRYHLLDADNGRYWPHMWTVSWLDARILIAKPCCSSMPSGRPDRVWRSKLTI